MSSPWERKPNHNCYEVAKLSATIADRNCALEAEVHRMCQAMLDIQDWIFENLAESQADTIQDFIRNGINMSGLPLMPEGRA